MSSGTSTWQRHQVKTFSALLVFCAGNSPVKRPVTRSFDLFFDQCLNQQVSKQWRRWWFETLLGSLWRHCDEPGQYNLCAMITVQGYNPSNSKVTRDKNCQVLLELSISGLSPEFEFTDGFDIMEKAWRGIGALLLFEFIHPISRSYEPKDKSYQVAQICLVYHNLSCHVCCFYCFIRVQHNVKLDLDRYSLTNVASMLMDFCLNRL